MLVIYDTEVTHNAGVVRDRAGAQAGHRFPAPGGSRRIRRDTTARQLVLAAGASEQQYKDAPAVAFAFNVTDRLADVFGFAVDDPAAINAGAKYLLARGYR